MHPHRSAQHGTTPGLNQSSVLIERSISPLWPARTPNAITGRSASDFPASIAEGDGPTRSARDAPDRLRERGRSPPRHSFKAKLSQRLRRAPSCPDSGNAKLGPVSSDDRSPDPQAVHKRRIPAYAAYHRLKDVYRYLYAPQAQFAEAMNTRLHLQSVVGW